MINRIFKGVLNFIWTSDYIKMLVNGIVLNSINEVNQQNIIP